MGLLSRAQHHNAPFERTTVASARAKRRGQPCPLASCSTEIKLGGPWCWRNLSLMPFPSIRGARSNTSSFFPGLIRLYARVYPDAKTTALFCLRFGAISVSYTSGTISSGKRSRAISTWAQDSAIGRTKNHLLMLFPRIGCVYSPQ